MATVSWDEILNRSTAHGAVSALILDMVQLQRNVEQLRKFTQIQHQSISEFEYGIDQLRGLFSTTISESLSTYDTHHS